MTKELRRHPRYEPKKPLNVYDTLSDERMGLLANLSAEGMMIIGNKDVVEGAVYQVRVPLDSFDTDMVDLGIECLWSTEAGAEQKYWSGYQIIDISDSDKTVLKVLIDALAGSE